MSIRRTIAGMRPVLRANRRAVLALAVLATCACAWLVGTARLSEDIASMLPGGATSVAEDFQRLGRAPLTRRLTITVSAPDGTAPQAAAALAKQLRPPYFTNVLSGPPATLLRALPAMTSLLPSLATAEDLKRLAPLAAPEAVGPRLDMVRSTLLSPQGPVFEAALRADPLGFGALLKDKMDAALPASNVRIRGGAMTTPDGNHALIIASSDIPMTDAAGSTELLERFEEAKAAALPSGARATLVSGHRFTHANATAVKRDLLFILPLSAAALGLILVLGIRSTGVLAVMAVPAAAFCIAGALAIPTEGGLSGIVLGFGGVLMGIAVDFALHVFFALRHAPERSAEHLGEVARPIALGALTSCAALGCLLLSDIPGIRQLAWFAMAGLMAAAILALTVLPLALSPKNAPTRSTVCTPIQPLSHPRLRIAVWLVLLAVCAAFVPQTRFNADLRALGHVPDQLAQDEQAIRETWGGMRGFAVVFAEGEDFAKALEANEAVYARLRTEAPDAHAVSLAPMLPAPATQETNRQRWDLFMDARRNALLRTLDDEAAQRGFADSAFAPFKDFAASSGVPVTSERLDVLGLSFLTDLLLDRGANSVTVMTLVPDTPTMAALFPPDVEQRLGAHLVSGSRFRLRLQDAMQKDVARFGLTALALVSGLVFLVLRDARRTLAALAPVLSGLAAIAAALFFGGGMNLFHVVSAPLVVGLGADYGIFMTLSRSSRLDLNTGRAVAISGLTTLAGLGALSLAAHPSMRSIGITVLAGIGAAMATALLVTPALAGGRR